MQRAFCARLLLIRDVNRPTCASQCMTSTGRSDATIGTQSYHHFVLVDLCESTPDAFFWKLQPIIGAGSGGAF